MLGLAGDRRAALSSLSKGALGGGTVPPALHQNMGMTPRWFVSIR